MDINAQIYRSDDRRNEDRVVVERTGTLGTGIGTPEFITVADLTRDGCRIESATELETGSTIHLGIAGVGMVEAEVRWRNGLTHGCAFVQPLPSGAVTAAIMSNVYPFPLGTEPVAVAAKASGRASGALLLGITVGGWAIVGLALHLLR